MVFLVWIMLYVILCVWIKICLICVLFLGCCLSNVFKGWFVILVCDYIGNLVLLCLLIIWVLMLCGVILNVLFNNNLKCVEFKIVLEFIICFLGKLENFYVVYVKILIGFVVIKKILLNFDVIILLIIDLNIFKFLDIKFKCVFLGFCVVLV